MTHMGMQTNDCISGLIYACARSLEQYDTEKSLPNHYYVFTHAHELVQRICYTAKLNKT